jgi:hypothetical protein
VVGAVFVVYILLKGITEFEVVAGLVLDGDDRVACGGQREDAIVSLGLEHAFNDDNVRTLVVPITIKLKKGLEGTTVGGYVTVADVAVAGTAAIWAFLPEGS